MYNKQQTTNNKQEQQTRTTNKNNRQEQLQQSVVVVFLITGKEIVMGINVNIIRTIANLSTNIDQNERWLKVILRSKERSGRNDKRGAISDL